MSSALSQESTAGPSYFILTLLSIDERGAQLSTLAGEEVTVVFDMDPTLAVVKDLGRWARRNLGLRGRTEPGEFTQIIWQNQVLGINQPLAMLLEGDNASQRRTLRNCTFCLKELWGPLEGTSATGEVPAPFPYCFFCEDRPSWHHGWCCPQNVTSCMYRGPTHADRTAWANGSLD